MAVSLEFVLKFYFKVSVENVFGFVVWATVLALMPDHLKCNL